MSLELDGGQESQRAGERSHAFLLRCWQEPDGDAGGAPAWRFSLTHIDAKREKRGFADLEALMAHLHQILATKNCITSEGEQS
jgi:hypothetical protein